MAHKDVEPVLGLVTERLPNRMFRVRLENNREIICYLSGRMNVNKIKVMIGDEVQVELDPYGGKCTNRITRRFLK